MRKRNIVLIFFLIVMMAITGCASNQNIEGKWVGTLDVTKQFEEGVKTAYPDLAKYVDFEELVFVLDISFVDGQMIMAVSQDSIDDFHENFAEGMEDIAEGYWSAGLATYDMTMEEAIYESGMTEEDYLASIYKSTGIDKMITGMREVTNETLNKISNMKGTYTTVGDELRLYYTKDNQTYEAMKYSLKGNRLNITIQGDGFSLLVKCKRAK